MLRPTDGTFARSRICHQQLLPWACVRLPLSTPSVTLRLFDSQTQKKHDIPWPAHIYHSSSAESQAPPLYEINEGGGGLGGQQGGLAGSLRHDVTLQREMKGGLCGPLVGGRGLVVLRRGGGEHQLLRRVNCAHVVAGCARTGWLRSAWQREQKDSS